jgi:hypothetical protein
MVVFKDENRNSRISSDRASPTILRTKPRLKTQADECLQYPLLHTLEAERSIIGASLIRANAIQAAIEGVTVDGFHSRHGGLIFDCGEAKSFLLTPGRTVLSGAERGRKSSRFFAR